MRIAMLCLAGGREGMLRAGAGQATGLASALADLGHEVHIFMAGPAWQSEHRADGSIHRHLVRVDGRGVSFLHSLTQSTVYYAERTAADRGPFDVVHAHHSAFVPVMAELRSRSDARLLLSLYKGGLATTPLPHFNGWSPLELLDGLIVSSASLREWSIKQWGLSEEKVVVLQPGVDLHRYSRWIDPATVRAKWGFGPQDPLVLYCGELVYPLGPDVLLEALFEVAGKLRDVRAVLLGDGPLAPYLRERAVVLGLAGSLRLPGQVGEEQMVELLNACNLVCLPSRSARVDQVVMQAWCAGKPVVVGRAAVPVFCEPGSDAVVVRPDPMSVAEAIISLLAEPAQAQQIGARAWQKAAAELAWTSAAAKLERTYYKALGREK